MRRIGFGVMVCGVLLGCPPRGGGEAAKPPPAYKTTRRHAVAGTFYPVKPDALRVQLERYLAGSANVKADGEVIAALAPHAGYVYSGSLAARVHKILGELDFDTLVIIGHDCYRDGVAYLTTVDQYQTPLGMVPVDTEMVKRLLVHPEIHEDRALHAEEHTVEVQLPFLQVQNKACRIVPILFGKPNPANCRKLAEAIKNASAGRKVFVLASTDLSHYPAYGDARKVDGATVEALKTLDVDALYAQLEQVVQKENRPEGLQTGMCAAGGVGTALVLALEQGANHLQVLATGNSGDVPFGNQGRVVGYVSALLVKKE